MTYDPIAHQRVKDEMAANRLEMQRIEQTNPIFITIRALWRLGRWIVRRILSV